MRPRVLASLLAVLTVLGSWAPGWAQGTPAGPDLSAATLTETDCAEFGRPDFDPVAELGSLRCGRLSVPENWRRPEGRRIDLGFAVLEGVSPEPEPDPVVYLSGGPGGSALIALRFFGALFAPMRAERDVVIFDQRGAAFSSPLRCPELSVDDLFAMEVGDEPPAAASSEAPGSDAVFALEPPLDPEALLDLAREQVAEAAARCVQGLAAAGVDLRQYNSIANANDTVALVRALGYDAYNLYGISYGTRLALAVMRDHPDSGLRSVVLDSTFPPEIRGFERYPAEPHEVVIQLFADCALDPACDAAYPNLKARFVALLDRLVAEPLTTAEGIEVGAAELAQVMSNLSADVAAVPYVPRMIAELERGETATFVGLLDGSLLPSDEAETQATPEAGADPAGATNAEAEAVEDARELLAEALPRLGLGDADDLSLAETFLGRLHLRIAELPYDDGQAVAVRTLFLGKLPPTRATLEAFVGRAFAGDEGAAARDDLRAIVAAMGEADVAEVFATVQGLVDALDPSALAINQPMFNAFECHEEIPFERFANTVATAERLEIPALGLPTVLDIAQQFAVCEVWPSGTAPEVESLPVASDAPALIMAGAYDLQTPVSWNKSAFVHLPNAQFVLFPMSGHATIVYSDCAADVAEAFIEDPVAFVDAACTAGLRPAWVLPDADGTDAGEAPATPAT